MNESKSEVDQLDFGQTGGTKFLKRGLNSGGVTSEIPSVDLKNK